MNGPACRCRMPIVTLAIATLMAGCAEMKSRPEPVAAPGTPAEAAPMSPAVAPRPPPPLPDSAQAQRSPWQRLRSRFAMPGCDYNPAVLKQAQRYTKSNERFSASWRRAMPFLLLVLDEVERRGLPGEFALLPYVESHYRPLPAGPGKPAGLWQLMPRTASDLGLRISRTRDERLDPVASTRVALDLLQRYDREFADWRLASMAFNAGEYRVKGALGKRRGADLSAADLGRLSLSPTTHEHLDRLLALACIVAEPERFGVSLPAAATSDVLEVVDLPAAIDPRLAASLAGIPFAELRHYNPSASPARSTTAPLHRLLLPRPTVDRFNAAMLKIPQEQRSHWKVQRIDRPMPLATLAANSSVPSTLLAVANNLAPHEELHSGQNLLVPGSEADEDPSATVEPQFHVIRAGDTLSKIAGLYSVSLGELLKWNSLNRSSTLRLGKRLRIRAPEY